MGIQGEDFEPEKLRAMVEWVQREDLGGFRDGDQDGILTMAMPLAFVQMQSLNSCICRMRGLDSPRKACTRRCSEHGPGCNSRVALSAADPPDNLN